MKNVMKFVFLFTLTMQSIIYSKNFTKEITDANWVGAGRSTELSVSQSNYCAADLNGNLYFDIQSVGGKSRSGIAKWNGTEWSETGKNINGYQISGIVFDKSGNIYASGIFDTINGKSCNVARWNGTEWSPLGSSIAQGLSNLVIDTSNNYLYALVNMDTVTTVMQWNGSEWSTLNGNINGRVRALAIDQSGNLYVGGKFDSAGTVRANCVVKWDGSSWNNLGAGISGYSSNRYIDDAVFDLIFDKKGNLFVCGMFDSAGLIAANNIAKWDGKTWSVLENGLDDTTAANAAKTPILPGQLIIDGNGNLIVSRIYVNSHSHHSCFLWNNETWNLINLPENSAGTLLYDNKNTIYLVSSLALKKWSDGVWVDVLKGNGLGNFPQYLDIDKKGKVYAAGTFRRAGTVDANQLAMWDGGSWNATSWNTFNLPFYKSITSFVYDNKKGALYVGCKAFNNVDDSAFIAKWDGGSWTTFRGRDFGYINTFALDSAGNLYVSGVVRGKGCGIFRWDGSFWTTIDSITCPNALCCDKNGALYVSGNFGKIGGVFANNIARWNGVTWNALGEGIIKDPDVSYPVNSLLLDKEGNLYVGGAFKKAGKVSVNNIAKWDGVSWSSLGKGVNVKNVELQPDVVSQPNVVRTLAFDSVGNLYVGGLFDSAGSIEARNIAQWDGSQWHALGSGLDAVAAAMACDGQILYVIGGFQFAGGKESSHFARCFLNGVNVQPSAKISFPRSKTTFDNYKGVVHLNINKEKRMCLSIYSLNGCKVSATTKSLPPGYNTFRIEKKGLAKGQYIIKVVAGDESLQCPLLVW